MPRGRPQNQGGEVLEHSPLLHLQASHRSQAVITGSSPPALTARHHMVKLEWHPEYKPYLIRAGLYGVQQIGHVPTDARLITALVEWWREETHTFHLPIGEATVTLEDVAVLFGLPIDGRPLVGKTDLNWPAVVQDLLGVPVTVDTFKRRSRTSMKLGWLNEHFHSLPDDADDITIQYYAQAFMLSLVGSVLFTDHSGDCVSVIYLPFFQDFDEAGQYSWGSAVLAYLYRELCLATRLERKQIGGALLLLQMWSWERFPFGRPQPRKEEPELGGHDDEIEARPPYGFKWSGHHEFAEHVTCRLTGGYRDDIDRFTDDSKVNWTPYEQEMHLLPPVCTNNSELWITTSPLIHFWIVEMYNPERVMRQFGLYQSFPPFFRDTMRCLHKMKHANCNDWHAKLAVYLIQWEHRWDNLVMENRPYDPSTFEDYKRWLSDSSILRLQTSLMRSADQPWIHPRLLEYQQIVPDMQSAVKISYIGPSYLIVFFLTSCLNCENFSYRLKKSGS
jgi:Plant mobile domain